MPQFHYGAPGGEGDEKRQPAEKWHMGKQIPVIVSSANGGYYISETTTAARSNNGQKYVAIADHIYSYSTFKDYITGTKYDTLAEAYAAYKERVENNVKYQDYKDTLPE